MFSVLPERARMWRAVRSLSSWLTLCSREFRDVATAFCSASAAPCAPPLGSLSSWQQTWPLVSAVRIKLITELNGAGFEELRLPHMAVLQFPGPDGVRPGVLAERVGMSKQAMNQLLKSLESLGYLGRSNAPGQCRARIIHFTKRGRAVYATMIDILRDIEREWTAELRARRFAELKELLFRVWESLVTR